MGFLKLKELFEKIKPRYVIKRNLISKQAPPAPPRCARSSRELLGGGEAGLNQAHLYKPTNIGNTRDNSFWQWRRVIAWEKYINDPLENKNGQHKFDI